MCLAAAAHFLEQRNPGCTMPDGNRNIRKHTGHCRSGLTLEASRQRAEQNRLDGCHVENPEPQRSQALCRRGTGGVGLRTLARSRATAPSLAHPLPQNLLSRREATKEAPQWTQALRVGSGRPCRLLPTYVRQVREQYGSIGSGPRFGTDASPPHHAHSALAARLVSFTSRSPHGSSPRPRLLAQRSGLIASPAVVLHARRAQVPQVVRPTVTQGADVVGGNRGGCAPGGVAAWATAQHDRPVPLVVAAVARASRLSLAVPSAFAGRAARAWRRRPTVDAGTHQGSTTRSRLARITSVLHRGRRPRLPSLSAYQPTASAPLGPRTRATADAAPPRCRPGTCRGPSRHDPPRSASRTRPARGRTGCGPSSGHGW